MTDRLADARPNAAASAVVLGIRAYRATLGPLLGPACRFHPSCSSYTQTCVERFGSLRGLVLGARRIARCHPFHPGGFDPPPELAPQAPAPSHGP